MFTKSSHSFKFNGSMLAEARLARALSQSQLGELSGVAKQSISNYENGKQEPKPDSVEKLAQHLNVPLTYFYTAHHIQDESPIFFRSLASLHKAEREKARVKLNWLARILSYFEEHLDLIPSRIPKELEISTSYKSITSGGIEEIAQHCRRHFGLKDGPISNMTMLLENNGLIIIRMPLNINAEDAFSRWVLNQQVPVATLVAEKPSLCRDRFSLAHELGHLVMHHKILPTQSNIKLLEEQANRFASSFLLPSHSYTRDFAYPSLDIFRFLKEKWKVSIQAQVIRCKQLGIISEDSAKRFFINISKRKWRSKEPLDDVLPLESPKVIKEATKLLCTDGGLTLEDISHETQLSVYDVAQLTGTPFKAEADLTPSVPTLKSSSLGKVIPLRPQ